MNIRHIEFNWAKPLVGALVLVVLAAAPSMGQGALGSAGAATATVGQINPQYLIGGIGGVGFWTPYSHGVIIPPTIIGPRIGTPIIIPPTVVRPIIVGPRIITPYTPWIGPIMPLRPWLP